MSEYPIKAESAAERVARHIEALIMEGSLRPDEPLLAERELATQLDVSRPTLRDGLMILKERGLLVGARGRGMRVATLGATAFTDPLITLFAKHPEIGDDYLEFRGVVESHAAAMAAKRANHVDHGRIRDCLRQIDAANEPAQEDEADIALHLVIYEASHNKVLLQIMRALSSNLKSDVIQNRSHMFNIPEMREVLRNQHHAIGEAILRRDPETAKHAAHEHLAYIRQASNKIQAAQTELNLSLRRLNGGGISLPAQKQ